MNQKRGKKKEKERKRETNMPCETFMNLLKT